MGLATFVFDAALQLVGEITRLVLGDRVARSRDHRAAQRMIQLRQLLSEPNNVRRSLDDLSGRLGLSTTRTIALLRALDCRESLIDGHSYWTLPVPTPGSDVKA